jgi:hypothetical protein
MSDRDDILKAIGAEIRKWTIGPDGVSADGEEDTNNLLRVLNAHPNLPQLLARQPDPEVEARKQMMPNIINRYPVGPAAASAALTDGNPSAGLPLNPMRMSEAIAQYRVACVGAKLAEKTVLERERLLKSGRSYGRDG